VFLNNDTFVSQDWLAPLLEAFQQPDVGLVGAKLIYPDGRLQEAGGIIFSDASGWNYGRGDDPANPKYEFLCDAHYCSGACIAIRRTLFETIGGFDPHFAPMYYEDVDLAFAVRAAGHRVVYQPACVIVHAEGGTSGTDTRSGAKRFQVVNQKKFAAKWREALIDQPSPKSNPDAARFRGTGPHVLIIDSYTPQPDHDAGAVRMVNIMRILRKLGCRVSFIPENRARIGEYTLALQAAGIEPLYHPFLPTMQSHLEDMGSRYHTVIASRVDVARQMIDAVRQHCPQARLIFDTVDLHFLREARRSELTGQRENSAEKEQELAVARACDLTLVVSPVEKEVLAQEAPDVAVEVLTLIHEPEPTHTPFSERSGIIFIANFQHPPNADALEHYLLEVHPGVCERLPGVDLTVIGADVPSRIKRLADSQVQFAGYVPDIRPAFASIRISVAPLRYGAGIKGKINTSLSHRVPVVTTTIGAEGMDLIHGKHLMIADRPPDFVDAVVSLYSDPTQWERLAEDGFQNVTARYSFDCAEQSLRQILQLEAEG
jgi:hypothetical protein